jgi:hypothetical protein
MAQAYAYARQAGFTPDAATIAAAIAMAESGLNTGSRGDVKLETSYWGPSVGLMQIRTVKQETGTGQDRDIARLDDPLQNMIAAYDISGKGKDFSPWTTYTSQKYRQFLGQAGSAAGSSTTGGTTAATPVNWLTDALGAGDFAQKARDLGLLLAAIAAGGTLVILGGYKLAGSPKPPKAAALALL